ncbi:mechanosensitive ion channel family protein [Parahaliea maris]|uniref:mechanosensitive ion channel family protein n=1 Tax=Parahaliea maris TaxID=2716870 RepID=UPI0016502371|nr:mechanosensitive ion channel family protein [Parahaliea maris]
MTGSSEVAADTHDHTPEATKAAADAASTTATVGNKEAIPSAVDALPPGASEAAQKLAEEIDGLRDWIARLQVVALQLKEGVDLDQASLTYRRDDRVIRLLTRANELAQEVEQLPREDAARELLANHLLGELADLGVAVFRRVDALQSQITKEKDGLTDRSGSDRELDESYLTSLEATRDHFLRVLADHIATRRSFELPVEDLLPSLKTRLLIQAESVAGRISFLQYTMGDLSKKLALNSNNEDLKAAFSEANDYLEHNLQRMRELVDIMETVEMDTAEYRSILVTEDSGISMDIIKPGVVTVLFSQWFDLIQDYLVSQGPDLILSVILFLTVLVIFYLLARLTRRGLKAALGRSNIHISMLMKDTLVSLSGAAVMLLGILMALSQIGVSLGPMLAGLGIAGFIIGFALQDTLSNFAAGAMILIYRPYDIDDYIEVPGASGVVKKMNLVSTTITTFDNQLLVVPNGKIWGDVIKNVTGQTVRRVDLEFGIGYGDDIPKAEAILAQIAKDHELVLDSPETVIKVGSLGDSSVNLLLRPWVKTADYWTVYWDMTREVKLRFDAEGISIPFPQRDVHFYSAGNAQDTADPAMSTE